MTSSFISFISMLLKRDLFSFSFSFSIFIKYCLIKLLWFFSSKIPKIIVLFINDFKEVKEKLDKLITFIPIKSLLLN